MVVTDRLHVSDCMIPSPDILKSSLIMCYGLSTTYKATVQQHCIYAEGLPLIMLGGLLTEVSAIVSSLERGSTVLFLLNVQ